MSNGYLVAASVDLTAAHEIAEGFGLDVIDASIVHDHQTTSAALAGAANVGVLLSGAAAQDRAFATLLRSMSAQLKAVQLILIQDDARASVDFLPPQWPTMSLQEARRRSGELLRRRQVATATAAEAPAAPHESEPSPILATEFTPEPAPPKPPQSLSEATSVAEPPANLPETPTQPQPSLGAAPNKPVSENIHMREPAIGETPAGSPAPVPAPADATAFAPSKLRRSTAEVVRTVVHQSKDLNAVIKAAKRARPTVEAVHNETRMGAIAGVALEVRGGACRDNLQRRTWTGDPLEFTFEVEADTSARQVSMLARVFIDEAQVGVISLVRRASGPARKPYGLGDRARLKRHKRVFLCSAGENSEAASAIAAAYGRANIDVFWDRAALTSGEEWHPRLRREIDRADLFHLCWSQAAASSERVLKATEHALTRRRKHSGKPEIAVQMVNGPPWALSPPSLDALGFGDFVRAAVAKPASTAA